MTYATDVLGIDWASIALGAINTAKLAIVAAVLLLVLLTAVRLGRRLWADVTGTSRGDGQFRGDVSPYDSSGNFSDAAYRRRNGL